jgi:chromosome segregation ATPase
MLESSHADNANPMKRTGVIFNLTAQMNPARETRAGEWNESRIVQRDGQVKFYLNGVLTTQQDFRSAAWTDSIGKTHFKTYPEFGKHLSGHIALQDWFKTVSFKNIRIREL